MAGTFIASTESRGLQLLGNPGQRSWGMLREVLLDRLGSSHAALLAEPVTSPEGERVDWYSAQDGAPERIDALSDDVAKAVRTTFEELKRDILNLADKIAESKQESRQRLAEALRNAMRVPSDDSLFALTSTHSGTVSVQPVLVDWARVPQGEQVTSTTQPAGTYTRRPEAVVPPFRVARHEPGVVASVAVAPAPAPERRWIWYLGWLLVGAFAAVILWLLIPACGLRPAALFDRCPPVAVLSERQAAESRTAALEARLADLQQQINAQTCDSFTHLDSPATVTEEARVTEIEQRLEEVGAQEGDFSVALSWNDHADLDLHVTCPDGSTVSYSARNVASCRGALDVDANVRREALTRSPVENIYFRDPMPGEYKIRVHLFKDHGVVGTHPFDIRIKFDYTAEVFEGHVSPGAPTWRTTYVYGE